MEPLNTLHQSAGRYVRDEEVQVPAGQASVAGHLTIPENARGVVVFAHGSGSSRHSPRNRYVAQVLNAAAADPRVHVKAIVSRGSRADLAGRALAKVFATCAGDDPPVDVNLRLFRRPATFLRNRARWNRSPSWPVIGSSSTCSCGSGSQHRDH